MDAGSDRGASAASVSGLAEALAFEIAALQSKRRRREKLLRDDFARQRAAVDKAAGQQISEAVSRFAQKCSIVLVVDSQQQPQLDLPSLAEAKALFSADVIHHANIDITYDILDGLNKPRGRDPGPLPPIGNR